MVVGVVVVRMVVVVLDALAVGLAMVVDCVLLIPVHSAAVGLPAVLFLVSVLPST